MVHHSLIIISLSLQLYVAFCLDLTLRVFNDYFELTQSVHCPSTILRFAAYTVSVNPLPALLVSSLHDVALFLFWFSV